MVNIVKEEEEGSESGEDLFEDRENIDGNSNETRTGVGSGSNVLTPGKGGVVGVLVGGTPGNVVSPVGNGGNVLFFGNGDRVDEGAFGDTKGGELKGKDGTSARVTANAGE